MGIILGIIWVFLIYFIVNKSERKYIIYFTVVGLGVVLEYLSIRFPIIYETDGVYNTFTKFSWILIAIISTVLLIIKGKNIKGKVIDVLSIILMFLSSFLILGSTYGVREIYTGPKVIHYPTTLSVQALIFSDIVLIALSALLFVHILNQIKNSSKEPTLKGLAGLIFIIAIVCLVYALFISPLSFIRDGRMLKQHKQQNKNTISTNTVSGSEGFYMRNY